MCWRKSPAADAVTPGSGTRWNELLSSTTLPVRFAGSGAYGNLPGIETVVSGSWRWRRSFQTE